MALLLREAIGGTIRRARTERRRTLRDVSRDARVSLGYLSEIERGRKEPSSELLAAICDALALSLPELLDDVADALRPEAPRRAPAHRLVGVDPFLRSAIEEAFEGAGEDVPVEDGEAAPTASAAPTESAATATSGAAAAPASGRPTGHAAPSAEVVDLAGDAAPVPADAGQDEDELGAFGDPEAPEPAGELRLVELVSLGREPAGVVRSAA